MRSDKVGRLSQVIFYHHINHAAKLRIFFRSHRGCCLLLRNVTYCCFVRSPASGSLGCAFRPNRGILPSPVPRFSTMLWHETSPRSLRERVEGCNQIIVTCCFCCVFVKLKTLRVRPALPVKWRCDERNSAGGRAVEAAPMRLRCGRCLKNCNFFGLRLASTLPVVSEWLAGTFASSGTPYPLPESTLSRRWPIQVQVTWELYKETCPMTPFLPPA